MKHFFTLFLLFICCAGYSQRAHLERYYFNASYRDLPRLAVDTSYRTISVRTGLSQSVAYMLRNEQPADRINVIGWRKVGSNGDLTADVQMEDIAIENSDVKEREEILKDKTGKETGRRYFYHMELVYSFAAIMHLSDYKGAHILERVLADRQSPKVFCTKEFNSSNEALNSFVSNVLAVTTTITSLEVNHAMNNLNALLNSSLGYCPRTVGDYLWILDTRKHPEYQAHRQAWASFKQAMFQMRADKPIGEVADMLRPVIAYFNAMKTRYVSDSKADRKMRYASYYNLAKIYYYLDDPDASLSEAEQLMINNYDEGDGRGLEAAATDLKQLFDVNKIRSRHFPVENDAINSSQVIAGY